MSQAKKAHRADGYWALALKNVRDPKMLAFASLIIALRVAVKAFRIPLAAGLSLNFDCYINALGSVVYGPLAALLVGAASDTLGCMLFPSGPYFPPFALVEMSSGFIFGCMLWRRRLTVNRVLAAKFLVNLVCNIVLTSLFMKWNYYVMYGLEKAEAYTIINLVRIGKNLVLFPLEAMLITLVLQAAAPILARMHLPQVDAGLLKLEKKHYILLAALLAASAALVLLYINGGAEFIKSHNFKGL